MLKDGGEGVPPDGSTKRSRCAKVLSMRSKVTELASLSLGAYKHTICHTKKRGAYNLNLSGRSISFDSFTAMTTFSGPTR